MSTFMIRAIKIFVYGAKGNETKLNVIVRVLVENLVCSGGICGYS